MLSVVAAGAGAEVVVVSVEGPLEEGLETEVVSEEGSEVVDVVPEVITGEDEVAVVVEIFPVEEVLVPVVSVLGVEEAVEAVLVPVVVVVVVFVVVMTGAGVI